MLVGPKEETFEFLQNVLLEALSEASYAEVARRFGVSDNAIRKWIVFYEREEERLRAEPTC